MISQRSSVGLPRIPEARLRVRLERGETRGRDEHQSQRPLGMRRRIADRRPRADRVAQQHRPRDAQAIHPAFQRLGIALDAIRELIRRGFGRRAESWPVQREDTPLRGEALQYRAIVAPRMVRRRQHDQRHTSEQLSRRVAHRRRDAQPLHLHRTLGDMWSGRRRRLRCWGRRPCSARWVFAHSESSVSAMHNVRRQCVTPIARPSREPLARRSPPARRPPSAPPSPPAA